LREQRAKQSLAIDPVGLRPTAPRLDSTDTRRPLRANSGGSTTARQMGQIGSVKANKYRRFSASNQAERGGNSSAKTAQL
jgi:hypothetical protein